MSTASARAALAGVLEPFPGLRPFESEEEPIFCGRRVHTDELLRRLAQRRFLAVVGSSGSGKSSLVRAGLRPALDRGYLVGATSRWRIAVMRPGLAPLANLVDALKEKDALAAADVATLTSSRLGLIEAVRAARLDRGESLLVVVDQFEEIFRFSRRQLAIDGGAEASFFVSLLISAAIRPDAPIYVVLTMRSDFLGDCAQFPGLPEALSESQYLIPRLTREQRRQAIDEPLRLFGASMTPQLVEQLLNDSSEVSPTDGLAPEAQYRGAAPDPLPILQHALMRTYDQWKALSQSDPGAPIDLTQYRAAGTLASALDRHAEDVFNSLDEDDKTWTERIFRCLTTTELGRPIRRPTPREELHNIVGARSGDRSKVDELLALFAHRENSFIRIYTDGTVDLSHESLIWKWKRLGRWISLEAASSELLRDVLKDARRMTTWGEPKLSATLTVRQRDAWNEDWARQYVDTAFHDVDAFLARSRTAARNQKWLRWFGWAAAVTMAILVVALLYSSRLALQKEREADAARVARDSLANELDRLKQEQGSLNNQIAALNVTQGATQEDKDRIAKAKAVLEAQLTKSQYDSKRLSDLLANVSSLESQLQQARRDRDVALQNSSSVNGAQKDIESKLAQASMRVDALTRELETARAGVAGVALGDETSQVFSIAWSPDGRFLASGNGNRTVRIWDVATRGPRVFEAHRGAVDSVSWSPDGKTLASGGDTSVRLWNVATGEIVSTLVGHQDYVNAVAWSPDGRLLASGGSDRTVRLWDGTSGQPVRTLEGHQGYVRNIAWSRDGKTLVSTAGDAVRFWDVASGRQVRTLQGLRTLQGQLTSDLQIAVAWSPDQKTLASAGSDGEVRLWEASSGRQQSSLGSHLGAVTSLAWSPDGKTLASAGLDQMVRLWNSGSGKLLQVLFSSGCLFRSVAWSPDGKIVAAAGENGPIRLWSVDVGSK